MRYNHTQIGHLMIYVIIGMIFYFGYILINIGLERSIIAILALVVVLVGSFSSLNVRINKEHLHIKFGYGIFKKKFNLKDIVSAKSVKNHWYNGWGIRVWFWPYMWIFNVSGFDAVELKMSNGKIYRIGTDEPKKLEEAILHNIR